MILNQLMRFEILGSKLSEARVRVAHSLEWWTCAQATQLSTRVPICFFFLKCVLFNEFIFKPFNFIENQNNIGFFLYKEVELVSKYRKFPVCDSLVCISSSLNSDARRIAVIKDIAPKHLYSTTLSDYRPFFFDIDVLMNAEYVILFFSLEIWARRSWSKSFCGIISREMNWSPGDHVHPSIYNCWMCFLYIIYFTIFRFNFYKRQSSGAFFHKYTSI